MRIAIFGNEHQKVEQIEHIFDILLANDVEIYIEKTFYKYLVSEFGLDYKVTGIILSNDDFEADLAISIGGDGTFLRSAACIGKKDIPLIGINTGRLGFLADISDNELDIVIADIFANKYRIEHRSLLYLETDQSCEKRHPYALNEIGIMKQDTASMLTIHAYIDDEFLTSYESDGLIISTPTGSTAYSLSVGGPIMAPSSASFILTAIAPHSLNTRPLVIDDNSTLTLMIQSRTDNFLVALDGRSEVLSTGTKLTIKKANHTLKVVKRLEHTFYGTLRNKLKWGVDPREK